MIFFLERFNEESTTDNVLGLKACCAYFHNRLISFVEAESTLQLTVKSE